MPVDPVAKLLQMTCARCHKLTHMGQVQSEAAEKELPPFDLAAALATQVKSNWRRRSVVLLVVDVTDFDGSLPRCASTVGLRALDVLCRVLNQGALGTCSGQCWYQ
jgi:hypothetical protein